MQHTDNGLRHACGDRGGMVPLRTGISVVVPVFNAVLYLPELVRRILATLDSSRSEGELVLVNDGSQDESWSVIQRLTASERRIRGINLSRNYGQHNALLCGIRAAGYDIIVTLDDDLQNPPEEIPHLLEQLTDDIDVVYGVPLQREHDHWRNLAAWIVKKSLQKAMGSTIAHDISPFRAFRTRLRGAFYEYRGPFPSIDVLLSWSTSRFRRVKVEHRPRQVGKSNYTFGSLVAHAFNMVTGFSVLPLQVVSLLGFVFAVLGLVALGFVLFRYFNEGSAVPGFAFLASTISVFSGVQLLSLGIIGEYIARMYYRTMDKPPFVVADTTGDTPGG